jgi:orotidine-5'-phosphate decarboxylase
MKRSELVAQIQKKKSMLCVGLDTNISLLPAHLKTQPDSVFEFNKAIVDATIDYAVAYKPNIAFYESMGLSGWKALEQTVSYIRSLNQPVFLIADAKRGDIGNTSKMYAKTFFEYMDFDSVTVAPYMGEDSVTPFLEYKDKCVIVLGLTSNKGASDFQFLEFDGKPLYEHVITKVQQWGIPENLMFVVGATQTKYIEHIRSIAKDYFFLVPGVGAQGGSLEDVCQYGMNEDFGLLINSTRDIIYASSGTDFAAAAAQKAKAAQNAMQKFIK